jgi:hypothetical protein
MAGPMDRADDNDSDDDVSVTVDVVEESGDDDDDDDDDDGGTHDRGQTPAAKSCGAQRTRTLQTLAVMLLARLCFSSLFCIIAHIWGCTVGV